MEHTIESVGWTEREGYPRVDLSLMIGSTGCNVDEDYVPERAEARGFDPYVSLTVTTDEREVDQFAGPTQARASGSGEPSIGGAGIVKISDPPIQHSAIDEMVAPEWIEENETYQLIVEIVALSQHRHHFEGAGLTLDYGGIAETDGGKTRFSHEVETALPDGDGVVVLFDVDTPSDHDADVDVPPRRNLARIAGDGTVDWFAADPGEDRGPYGSLCRIEGTLYNHGTNQRVDPATGELTITE